MLNRIKDLYRNSPGALKLPLMLAPFSMFLGKGYRHKLKEISFAQDVSLAHARSMAIDMFLYASQHVKFYRDYVRSKKIVDFTWDDFSSLPILTKEQISSDYEWFLSDEYNSVNSYIVTTGGTTGRQTRICMSNSAYRIEWAFVNSFLKRHGVDPDSRRLCLRGVDFGSRSKGDLMKLNPLYKELQISPFMLDKERLGSISEKLVNFKASWIHGYPSTVAEFCKVAKALGIERQLGIKHVLLVSEKTYPDQLEVIQSVLGADVLTFYGMSERVVFAEGEQGVFYPNHNYGYTEEVNGELIGTGYINKAMPLLRYATGDSVRVTKNEDLVVSIDSVLGRWGKEYLVSKSGIHFGMTSLNVHSDIFERIKGYQFYQERQGSCVLRLQLFEGDSIAPLDVKRIVEEFEKKVGSELEIHPLLVAELDKSPRGKHIFIVNKIGG